MIQVFDHKINFYIFLGDKIIFAQKTKKFLNKLIS